MPAGRPGSPRWRARLTTPAPRAAGAPCCGRGQRGDTRAVVPPLGSMSTSTRTRNTVAGCVRLPAGRQTAHVQDRPAREAGGNFSGAPPLPRLRSAYPGCDPAPAASQEPAALGGNGGVAGPSERRVVRPVPVSRMRPPGHGLRSRWGQARLRPPGDLPVWAPGHGWRHRAQRDASAFTGPTAELLRCSAPPPRAAWVVR